MTVSLGPQLTSQTPVHRIRRASAFLVGVWMFAAACSSSSDGADSATEPAADVASDAAPTSDSGTVADEPSPSASASDDAAPDAAVESGDVAEPAARCDEVDRINVVRERSVPGGRQLHLALTGDGETSVAPSLGACLEVEDARLGGLEVAVDSSPVGAGATLIVVPWDTAQYGTARAFIDEYTRLAPDDEVIAIWSWTDELRQVVGATTDRERLAQRLDAVPPVERETLLGIEEVADRASEVWEDLADDALLGLRSVVFVAPDFVGDALPDLDRDVVTDYWVVGADVNDRTFALSSPTADAAGARAAAVGIAEMLDGRRAGELVRVGFCDDGGDLDLVIRSGVDTDRSISIGDAADEHIGQPCDPAAAAAFRVPDMTVLEVTFDDEQRARYDAAVAAADSLVGRDRIDPDAAPDPEWTGTMTYDGAESPAPFTADFRGQSTIECARRSWSIDFDGADARHLFPRSGTDEFTLVSMCADPGYVHQIIGAAVMQEFGLWSLESSTVELRVDGVSQGVYLAIEKLDDEIRNDRTGVTSIVRRGYDVVDIPTEVEYAADDVDAIAGYDAILAATDGRDGDELVDALGRILDLDQYLRWIAVNVALGSGDYIDEVFFIAENSVDETHETTDYYTVHGWDPDGIFSPCHRDGRFEIDDPNGLLVCTESLLDQRVFVDAVVYDRYVDILESVLEDLQPERFTGVARAAADSIIRWFDDPQRLAAMVEFVEEDPGRLDREVAADVVNDTADDLVEQFTTLRSELIERIDAYRGE